MSGRAASMRTVIGLVLRNELRSLLRDRRALFTAIVLPALLYPLMFYGMDVIDRVSEESLEEQELHVAYELSALPAEVASEILAACGEIPHLELTETSVGLAIEISELSTEEARERWAEIEYDLLMIATLPGAEDALPELALWSDKSNTLSDEADERIRAALTELADGIARERILLFTGGDPAIPLSARDVDVARPEDASGRALGRLLPFIAVLVLVSGGSFAALDSFAGERESGTLETLFVQPVPALSLALGKFLAVLITGCAALLGNAASFLVCLKLGLGNLPAGAEGLELGTHIGRMALGLAVFLPTAVLLTALLCLISARARSFREGQHYVFPLILISLAPASLATVERVDLNYMLALVPIGNAALAFRDALTGNLAVGPALLTFAVSAGWSALALRRLAHVLDAERLLTNRDSSEERAARKSQARHALRWAFAAIGLVYVLGGWMQSQDLVIGLSLTLGVLVPTLALLCARGAARRAQVSLATALNLGAPRVTHLVGALLLAPAFARIAQAVLHLQQTVMPLPSNLELPELDTLGGPALFALLCLAPGLAEELLFRGAILFGLARDLKKSRVILWQAVLFGAVHASIYRFVPTAILGAVLAAVCLRARCVWPAMVLHIAYNAMVVFDLGTRWPLAFTGVAPWIAGALGTWLFVRTPKR